MKLQNLIENRMEYLQKIIHATEKDMEKLPTGNIRVIKHGSGYQYYLRRDKKDKNGSYMTKREQKLAQKMLQREYDKKVVQEAGKELRILEKLSRIYTNDRVEQLYEKLPKGKQILISPMKETRQQFLEKWMNMKFEELPFRADAPEYFSNSGIRMRSKSEVIIANLLDRMEIPYRYEMPLLLEKDILVRPDFTLIDATNQRVIYWEHLGMLDDAEYANRAISKIQTYEKAGFYLGERLIITGESSSKTLNIKQVEQKLQHIWYEK